MTLLSNHSVEITVGYETFCLKLSFIIPFFKHFIPFVCDAGCHGSVEEEDLMAYLVTEQYQSNVRPVINDSDALTVYMGLSISQIIDVVSNKSRSSGYVCRVQTLYHKLPDSNSCHGMQYYPLNRALRRPQTVPVYL